MRPSASGSRLLLAKLLRRRLVEIVDILVVRVAPAAEHAPELGAAYA